MPGLTHLPQWVDVGVPAPFFHMHSAGKKCVNGQIFFIYVRARGRRVLAFTKIKICFPKRSVYLLFSVAFYGQHIFSPPPDQLLLAKCEKSFTHSSYEM